MEVRRIALASVLLLVGYTLAVAAPPPMVNAPGPNAAPPAPSSADTGVNLRRTVTVRVVEQTKDAVVNVATTTTIERPVAPFGDDPFWQQFDMGGEVARVPANSLGSGFIVQKDGYVVTNNHVIDHARKITVELADGRKLPAQLISADAQADLAILKISSDKPFPTLQLGDSSDLMIGEPVIAVGNPMGYSHSVSTGIVSALHRDLKNAQERTALTNLIQTDAAINPGNSGGPLLNAYGQVIGINTAIRSDAQNIGFAIQINRLRDLIPQLMNPAQVTKVDVPVTLKEERTITPPANIHVILRDATGQQAQLLSIDGQTPANIVDAYAMLLKVKPDQKVTLQFASAPARTIVARAAPQPDAVVAAHKRLGITIEELTPMLAEKYHLSVDDGLLITDVDRAGVGAKAGLDAGDIIVQLGRYRVGSLHDMGVLMHDMPATGRVRIGVVRGDQVLGGTLNLGND